MKDQHQTYAQAVEKGKVGKGREAQT